MNSGHLILFYNSMETRTTTCHLLVNVIIVCLTSIIFTWMLKYNTFLFTFSLTQKNNHALTLTHIYLKLNCRLQQVECN